ncbi:phage holin family protein [Actinomadura sp. DC4]|uniref:phage holin family protein n=1 Tax=Actinomadura sp. DC4 TaxID=3055069 RepID=UPI0025B145A4|nr:phage holin family protein [Actinomadura sp. DC4]MDN3354539.1 phage holin family protein [Actinomadura sp. DC4]
MSGAVVPKHPPVATARYGEGKFHMTEVRSDGQLEDMSVGELVKFATGSVSQLVKSEIELAKLELKDDAKRAALGSTLFAVAGVTAAIVLIMLSIAAAFGLITLGIWNWAAFLIVAGAYLLLGGILVGIGLLRMKKMSGVSRTRRTVKEDIAMLRRGGDEERPAITE